MNKSGGRGVIRRLIPMLLAVILGLLGVVGVATPASAAIGTNDYPYANIGGGSNTSSTWADSSGSVSSPYGFYYRNCTDFVAWRLNNDNKFTGLPHGIGTGAASWGSWAQGAGYTVNGIPAIGAVAWWAAGALDNSVSVGSFGHVAYVDSINTNGSVNIEEYNWDVNGVFDGAHHTRTITPGTSGQQVQFIHLADITSTPSSDTHDIVVQVGSTLYGKANPTDAWTTLATNYSSGLQVSGGRIAMIDTSGVLEVKDGITGTWYLETSGFDEYEISSSLLVVRVGSTLYGKANLGDQWSTLTTGATPGIKVAGNRIAFVTGGSLLTKDGLTSQWATQMSGFDEYAMTPSLLVVRVGSTLYGKANLGDQWSTLTTGATPGITASDNRIAFVSGGVLEVKDGITGTWYGEISGFDEYEMSSSVLAVRVSSTLYGKANLTDQWSTLTTGAAAGVRVSGNLISYVSGGTLMIKADVGGTWDAEINGFDSYAIG